MTIPQWYTHGPNLNSQLRKRRIKCIASWKWHDSTETTEVIQIKKAIWQSYSGNKIKPQ